MVSVDSFLTPVLLNMAPLGYKTGMRVDFKCMGDGGFSGQIYMLISGVENVSNFSYAIALSLLYNLLIDALGKCDMTRGSCLIPGMLLSGEIWQSLGCDLLKLHNTVF